VGGRERPVLFLQVTMKQQIDTYVLPNGMVLLGEPMAGVE